MDGWRRRCNQRFQFAAPVLKGLAPKIPISQAKQIEEICRTSGIPVWCGGMLESGIGRAHNIHLASLSNFSLPGDIAASRRYFSPDLIEPGIEVSREGTVAVPTGPGIGVTAYWDRVKAATIETYDVRA